MIHTYRYAGDDWKGNLAFNFQYGSPDVDNNFASPINLTGYAVQATFFCEGQSVDLTTDNGRAEIVDAVNGKIALTIERAVTTTFATSEPSVHAVSAKLQVQLIDPDGNLGTLVVIPVSVVMPGEVPPWMT